MKQSDSFSAFMSGKYGATPCIVCGSLKPHMIGLWEPSENMNPLFGTKEGRYKHLIYAMCEKHYPGNGYSAEEVEKHLIRTYVEGKAKQVK